MKKYFALIKTNFLNALVYRVDFFFWGFNELLDTLIFLFIWIIIFGENQIIGGFTLPETITYLIGAGIIANITFTWIEHDLEQDIKGGNLSNILIKPISYPIGRAISSIATKPIDISIRLAVYFMVAFFFRDKFIINNDLLTLFLFAISIFFAYIINILIHFCFGCIAFWTIANHGIFGIFRTISSVFAGGYAPITFFPKWFQTTSVFLPFAYTRYFPMLIYLEKDNIINVLKGMFIQVLWIVVLFILARFIWNKGIKNYEGVGI